MLPFASLINIFMGSEKKAGLAVDKLLDYIEEFTRKTVMSQE